MFLSGSLRHYSDDEKVKDAVKIKVGFTSSIKYIAIILSCHMVCVCRIFRPSD